MLPAPVLSCNSIDDCDCPAKCDHLDFHPFLRDRVHYKAITHFEKASRQKKFKYDYLQMITYLQNFGKNWSQETCGSDNPYNGAFSTFDCLTVCLADTPAELISFIQARYGDSRVASCTGAKQLIYNKAKTLRKFQQKWAP